MVDGGADVVFMSVEQGGGGAQLQEQNIELKGKWKKD